MTQSGVVFTLTIAPRGLPCLLGKGNLKRTAEGSIRVDASRSKVPMASVKEVVGSDEAAHACSPGILMNHVNDLSRIDQRICALYTPAYPSFLEPAPIHLGINRLIEIRRKIDLQGVAGVLQETSERDHGEGR